MIKFRKDIPLEFNEAKIITQYRERLDLVRNGVNLPPVEIQLHPTSKCNLSCKWCIGRNLQDTEHILNDYLAADNNLINLAKDICNYKKKLYINGDLKEFKVERISFTGITGDPLMASNKVIPALKIFQENNVETGMFTNGLLIAEDEYIDTIVKMKYALISLDSSTPEEYDKLKSNGIQTDRFNRVIENIRKVIKFRNENDGVIEINIGFVLTDENYENLYSLCDLVKSIGVHYLRIKTDIASKNNVDPNLISKINKMFLKIETNLCDDKFDLVYLHRLGYKEDKERRFDKCTMNRLFSNISADGNIYACNYHPSIDNGIIWGNVMDKKFSDIWDNTNFNLDVNLQCPMVCDPFKTRANSLLYSYNKLSLDEKDEFCKVLNNELR